MKRNLINDLIHPVDVIKDERSLLLKKQDSQLCFSAGFVALGIVTALYLVFQGMLNMKQYTGLVSIIITASLCAKTLLSCFHGTLGITDKKGGIYLTAFSCILAALSFCGFSSLAIMQYNRIFFADAFIAGLILIFLLYHWSYRQYLATLDEDLEIAVEKKIRRKKFMITTLFFLYFLPSVVFNLAIASETFEKRSKAAMEESTPAELKELNLAVDLLNQKTSMVMEVQAPLLASEGDIYVYDMMHYMYYLNNHENLVLGIDDSTSTPFIWKAELSNSDGLSSYYVDGTWYSLDEMPYLSDGSIKGQERLPHISYSEPMYMIQSFLFYHVSDIHKEEKNGHIFYSLQMTPEYFKEMNHTSANILGVATVVKDQMGEFLFEMDQSGQILSCTYQESGIYKKTDSAYEYTVTNRVVTTDEVKVREEMNQQLKAPFVPPYAGGTALGK